jgi:hypothetical protein
MQVADGDDDWQCISCRQGATCPCSWCKKHKPHQPGSIDMQEEFDKLQLSLRDAVPGTPSPPARTVPLTNTINSPPLQRSSSGGGPSHRGPRAITPPVAFTPPPGPTPPESPRPSSGGAGRRLLPGHPGLPHPQPNPQSAAAVQPQTALTSAS